MSQTVTVSVNGKTATWTYEDAFTGDPTMVREAQSAVCNRFQYELHGVVVLCADTNPLGALAALSVTNPGRAVVTEAPGEVLAYVFGGYDDDIPERTLVSLTVDDGLTNPADED